ncbi:MAG: DNA primase [Candidatus Omnitrophota bacterium]
MGLIPEDVINQVLERSDIVDVVSWYIPLKPAGRNFKALSPFKNEKTPSFIVSPDKQIFHCFSTGEGGNAITFVMKMERMTFPEAVRLLADRYNIVIPENGPDRASAPKKKKADTIREINRSSWQFFHKQLLSDRSAGAENARRYLKDRGISREMVETFRLGYAPDSWDRLLKFLQSSRVPLGAMEAAGLILSRKSGDGYYDRFRNRIVFPIFDVQDRCVAFGARTLDPENPVKYVNSPETPVYVKGRHLYGLNLSKYDIGREDMAVIVEGYMDFITPFAAGFKPIAASLGTALTVEQIRLLKRYTRNVILLYDADPAGEAAMSRSLELLVEEGMHARVVVLDEDQDPDSFLRQAGVDGFREKVKTASSMIDYKLDFLTSRYGVQTQEGRSRVAAEMLKTVQRLPEAITRTEAVHKLAGTLSVVQNALMTEQALMDQLKNMAQPRRQPEQRDRKDRAVGPTVISVTPAEKNLLRLMMSDGAFIDMVRAELPAEDFLSEPGSRIADMIFRRCEGGQKADAAELLTEIQDGNIANFLTALMTEENDISGDRQKLCRDCIGRIKKEAARKERRKIMSAMEQAREAGDLERLNELTQQFNQLIKR